jgi:hypothetical protein
MDSTRLGSLTMTARFLFTEAIAKRQMKRDKLLRTTNELRYSLPRISDPEPRLLIWNLGPADLYS